MCQLGHVAQLVAYLTQEPEVPGLIPGRATYFCFSYHRIMKGSCQYWRKNEHLVLVNCSSGLILPRNSLVRLTDCTYLTMAIYCGRKATKQQHCVPKPSIQDVSRILTVRVYKTFHGDDTNFLLYLIDRRKFLN